LGSDPDVKNLAWITGILHKGLTRVFAVDLGECLADQFHDHLVERVRQRTGDNELATLLKKTLAMLTRSEVAQPGAIARLLGCVAFESIDRVLHQAQAVGRDGAVVRLAAARFGQEVVVLADHDPQHAWLLPTTAKRLREALAELGVYPTAAETQTLDLSQGDKLQLLGHEFRVTTDRRGRLHVDYQRLEPLHPRALPGDPPTEETTHAPPKRPWAMWLSRLTVAWHWLGRLRLREGIQFLQTAWHSAQSFQASWRHLPITLYPIVGFVAGWNSPLAWLCVLAIIIGNWRLLPLALKPVWRHRGNVTLVACGLTLVVCLYLLISDFWANVSGETAAPHMPAGFYVGRYNKGSITQPDLVRYGLYLPPHFKRESGPFPLIVYLHGWGDPKEGVIFQSGIAWSVARKFGPKTPNGEFKFAVLFPIDPKGLWVPGSPGVQDALLALDYVIARHRIDPARVYLRGCPKTKNYASRRTIK
jgi:hypothetical protein